MRRRESRELEILLKRVPRNIWRLETRVVHLEPRRTIFSLELDPVGLFPEGERFNSRGPAQRSPRCAGKAGIFPEGERVSSRGPASEARCEGGFGSEPERSALNFSDAEAGFVSAPKGLFRAFSARGVAGRYQGRRATRLPLAVL